MLLLLMQTKMLPEKLSYIPVWIYCAFLQSISACQIKICRMPVQCKHWTMQFCVLGKDIGAHTNSNLLTVFLLLIWILSTGVWFRIA